MAVAASETGLKAPGLRADDRPKAGPSLQGRSLVRTGRRDTRQGEPFILIVDDEPAVLEVTRAMTASLGWRPLLANSAAHAVAVFREHAASIAFVLLDLHVSGVEGGTLVRALRAIRPDIPIELMTGDRAGAEPLLAAGLADGLLVKPFVIDDLGAALEVHPRAA
jgi:CheY-like chemotaxis protein